MKNKTIKLITFLLLAIFVVSCGQITARWNPNKQPVDKLATLKLVNAAVGFSGGITWEVLNVSGKELSKYWIPNEDTIRISTEEHLLEVGIRYKSGTLTEGGRDNFSKTTLKLNLTKLIEPGVDYVLTSDIGSILKGDGPGITRFVLEKKGFLFNTTLQTWVVKLVGTNKWKIISQE